MAHHRAGQTAAAVVEDADDVAAAHPGARRRRVQAHRLAPARLRGLAVGANVELAVQGAPWDCWRSGGSGSARPAAHRATPRARARSDGRDSPRSRIRRWSAEKISICRSACRGAHLRGRARNCLNSTRSSSAPDQLQEPGRPELVERRRRSAIVGDARAPALVRGGAARHLIAPRGESLAGAERGGDDREKIAKSFALGPMAGPAWRIAMRHRVVGRAANSLRSSVIVAGRTMSALAGHRGPERVVDHDRLRSRRARRAAGPGC